MISLQDILQFNFNFDDENIADIVIVAVLIHIVVFSIVGVLALGVYLYLFLFKYEGPAAGSCDAPVSVQLVVLGDIGRSPRMTYHALSIAKHGGKVNLVGYLETSPHPDLENNPNITISALPLPPRKPFFIPFIIFAPLKVIYQTCYLTWLLTYGTDPTQWMLVQNPPSIPTLAVASFACWLRNTMLIFDWHNYGWTILSGTRGAKHPLVFLAKLYERFLGRHGDLHLTVTDAMARELRKAPYSIPQPILPVHDRPAAIFQPLGSPSARAEILARVLPDAEKPLVPNLLDGTMRLLVSSTSWTPDEDFSLLLDALVKYAATTSPAPVPVLAIITGKGPQQATYLAQIAALTKAGRLPNVRIVTAFLPLADYAGLLACADLGVCLHKSSSGVDLPMKVVDMFGAGLPVAAYSKYESFGELVKEGVNGKGFETAQELAGVLGRLLGDKGRKELEGLRKGAVKEGNKRWDEEWDLKVGRVLGLVD